MKIQEIAYQAFEFVNVKVNRKMKNYLEYKGYIGTTAFSAEDKVFFGKIQGINDLVTFEGTSVKALEKSFNPHCS